MSGQLNKRLRKYDWYGHPSPLDLELNSITAVSPSSRQPSSQNGPPGTAPKSFNDGGSRDMPRSYGAPADKDGDSLFISESNEGIGQPRDGNASTDFLGGARTGSPEPMIKNESFPESIMGEVPRYSPEPFDKYDSRPDEAFGEGSQNQGEQRSSKRKYTKRKPVDRGVPKPPPTRKRSTRTMPSDRVTCNRCDKFYKGNKSKCLGSEVATVDCQIHKSAREALQASRLTEADLVG